MLIKFIMRIVSPQAQGSWEVNDRFVYCIKAINKTNDLHYIATNESRKGKKIKERKRERRQSNSSHWLITIYIHRNRTPPSTVQLLTNGVYESTPQSDRPNTLSSRSERAPNYPSAMDRTNETIKQSSEAFRKRSQRSQEGLLGKSSVVKSWASPRDAFRLKIRLSLGLCLPQNNNNNRKGNVSLYSTCCLRIKPQNLQLSYLKIL